MFKELFLIVFGRCGFDLIERSSSSRKVVNEGGKVLSTPSSTSEGKNLLDIDLRNLPTHSNGPEAFKL